MRRRLQSRVTELLPVLVLLGVTGPFASAQERTAAVRTLQQSASPTGVEELRFSADGRKLVTTNHSGTVEVWSVATGKLVRTLRGSGIMIRALAWGPKGTLIGGARDGFVWQLAERPEELRRVGRSPVKHVNQGGLAVSADEKVLYWHGAENSVVATELASGKTLRTFGDAFRDDPRWKYVAVSGGLLAAGSHGRVRLFDTTNGRVLHTLDASGPVAVSPDQKLVACVVDGRDLAVFDAATGREKYGLPFEGNPFVLGLAVSPDGKWIAVGNGDDTARVVNAVTGREHLVLRHESFVDSVAFSPDSNVLATGSRKGFVRLFDVETGKIVGGHGAAADSGDARE